MTQPQITLDASASPGDIFRAIADWYDRTGEPMPTTVTIYRHEHEVPLGEGGYAQVLAERYGTTMHVDRTPGGSTTRRTELSLHAGRPDVILHGYTHHEWPKYANSRG